MTTPMRVYDLSAVHHRTMSWGPLMRRRIISVVTIFCAAGAVAGPAEGAAGADATLTGTITDNSGHPLGGVSVVLAVPAGDEILGLTDATGAYEVDDIPAGSYRVCFDVQSATGGSVPTGYVSECYKNAPYEPYGTPDVTFAAGQHRVIDASVAGGGAIGGTIRDTAGHPIGQAQVRIVGLSDPSGTNHWLSHDTTSNADGTYRSAGLLPGSYRVCFPFASGTDSPGHLGQCWQDVGIDDAPTPVTVTAGRTTAVSPTLLTGAAVSGHVRDTAGRPVPDARVDAYATDGTQTLTDTRGPSGASTAYRIAPLPAVPTVVCASATTAVTGAPYGYATRCWRDRPPDSSATPLTLRAGVQTKAVDIALSPTGGAVSGTVRDRAGRLVGGAEVVVTPAGGGYPATTFGSGDGRFEVDGLAPGRYTVCSQPGASLNSPTYADGTTTPPYSFAGACAAAAVTVTARTRTSNVAVPIDLGGAVSGRVHDPDGRPLLGVRVTIRDSAGRTQAVTTGQTVPEFRAVGTLDGVAGTYRFTGLTAGTYTVCFDARATPYASGCYSGLADQRPSTAGAPVSVRVGAWTKHISVRLRPLALGVGGRTPDRSGVAVGTTVSAWTRPH